MKNTLLGISFCMYIVCAPGWMLTPAEGTACCLPQEKVEQTEQAFKDELKSYPNKVLCEAYYENNWELSVMNADGSSRRKLTDTPNIHEHYPQASPDGAKICFLADVGEGKKAVRSIWMMNADGTERQLVADKGRHPCWSPDGGKIAYLGHEFDRLDIMDYVTKYIYFYDVETGLTSRHPNDKVHHIYNLSWSACGAWLVATVHGGMGYGHTMLAIEVEGQRVIDLKIPGCRPTLSPDGNKITWSSDDHTINVADIDFSLAEPKVSNVRVVHQHKSLHFYHPDFSPDGELVTFSVSKGGRQRADGPGTHVGVAELIGVRADWDIWLKRADGSGPVLKLTEGGALSSKESDWLPAKKFEENM